MAPKPKGECWSELRQRVNAALKRAKIPPETPVAHVDLLMGPIRVEKDDRGHVVIEDKGWPTPDHSAKVVGDEYKQRFADDVASILAPFKLSPQRLTALTKKFWDLHNDGPRAYKVRSDAGKPRS